MKQKLAYIEAGVFALVGLAVLVAYAVSNF